MLIKLFSGINLSNNKANNNNEMNSLKWNSNKIIINIKNVPVVLDKYELEI